MPLPARKHAFWLLSPAPGATGSVFGEKKMHLPGIFREKHLHSGIICGKLLHRR